MNNKTVTILGVGDLSCRAPEPEEQFTLVAPLLKSADIVVGQVETPYTNRPTWTNLESPGTSVDPENLRALTFAGFNVATLAGNHVWDAGLPGMEDTINWLRNHNIPVVGAGMNIDEARRPLVIERKGTRIGFLDYNCTGPKEGWASQIKPGCAYVQIITHYELDHSVPGGTPSIYTWPEPVSLKAMVDDIRKLRPLCDVLVVCFHKGIIHTPITLAGYEQPVSYAAIDAGADLILAEHAHILKGIEIYRGKAIFHNLANFMATRKMLSTFDVKVNKDSQNWAKKRKRLYNFEPDPVTGFHPEAMYSIIAKVSIEGKQITKVSYLPCLVNEDGKIKLLNNDKRGQEVFDYMDKITKAAELNAQYRWDGDEIAVYTE